MPQEITFSTSSGNSSTIMLTTYDDEKVQELQDVEQQYSDATRGEDKSYSAAVELVADQQRKLANKRNELDRVHNSNIDKLREAYLDARRTILSESSDS